MQWHIMLNIIIKCCTVHNVELDYKSFKDNISTLHKYKSSISFVSMEAELTWKSPGHGPYYCFRVLW